MRYDTMAPIEAGAVQLTRTPCAPSTAATSDTGAAGAPRGTMAEGEVGRKAPQSGMDCMEDAQAPAAFSACRR